ADVVRLADRGNGAEIRGILTEAAADGAFELLRDDEADTLDGIGHLCHVDRQLDRLVLRKHAPPVEEFTLEQTADERRFADRKEDMLAAKEEGAGLVGIAEDLFRFLATLQVSHGVPFSTDSDPVPVHSSAPVPLSYLLSRITFLCFALSLIIPLRFFSLYLPFSPL
ncbi:hypothetical protein, partial [[Ruminococcus] torques]|uniref:hypothetical protein n=1 Tax=[Ruminococcus] torques TaxID=33039 RepID=UPI00241EB3B4